MPSASNQMTLTTTNKNVFDSAAHQVFDQTLSSNSSLFLFCFHLTQLATIKYLLIKQHDAEEVDS